MELPIGKSWYSFTNAAENVETPGVAELWIFDVITSWGNFDPSWGISAENFRKDLARALEGATSLTIHINSPGGEVMDGVAIANLIKGCKVPTLAIVEGWAASIATVIAIAAERVEMRPTALMMIHNPSGMAFGESKDMRKTADVLDKIRDSLVIAYQDKTGKGKAAIERAMDDETWFTSAEAVAWGLCDAQNDGEAVHAVNLWPMERFEFKNLKPEYIAVGAGKVFASAAAGLTFRQTTAQPRRPSLVPVAILEAGQRAGTRTEGAMEIKDLAGLRAAHGGLVAQVEAEVRAACAVETKTAVDAAATGERERCSALLQMGADSRLHETVRAEMLSGAKLTDSITKIETAKAALKTTAVTNRAAAEGALPDYGSGATGGDGVPAASARDKWDGLLKTHMETAKCSMAAAITAMQAAHPGLHAQVYGLPQVALSN